MKPYYIRAIDLNNQAAMNNLGTYYADIEANHELAKNII